MQPPNLLTPPTHLVHQTIVLVTLMIASVILAYLPLISLHYFHRQKRRAKFKHEQRASVPRDGHNAKTFHWMNQANVRMMSNAGGQYAEEYSTANDFSLNVPTILVEFVRSFDAGLLLAALFLIFIPQLRTSFDTFVLAHVSTAKLSVPLEMVQPMVNSSLVATNISIATTATTTLSPMLTKQIESVHRQQDETNYTATSHKDSPIPLVELILCLSFFALNFAEEFSKMCLKYQKYFWACNSSVVHGSSTEQCDFTSLDYRLNKTKNFLITCSRRTFSTSTSNSSENKLNRTTTNNNKSTTVVDDTSGRQQKTTIKMKISHHSDAIVDDDDDAVNATTQSKSHPFHEDSFETTSFSSRNSSIEYPSYYFNTKLSKTNVHFAQQLTSKMGKDNNNARSAEPIASTSQQHANEIVDDRYNSLYDHDASYLDSITNTNLDSHQQQQQQHQHSETPSNLFTKIFLPNTTFATCMPTRYLCEGILLAIQPNSSMLWLMLSVIIVHKLVIALSVSFELYEQTSGNQKYLPTATMVTFIFFPLLGYVTVMAVNAILAMRQRQLSSSNEGGGGGDDKNAYHSMSTAFQLEVAAVRMILISLSTAALLHFLLIVVQKTQCPSRLHQTRSQPKTSYADSATISSSGTSTSTSTTPCSTSTFGFLFMNKNRKHPEQSSNNMAGDNYRTPPPTVGNFDREIVSNPPRYSVLHLFIMYIGFIVILLILAFINIGA